MRMHQHRSPLTELLVVCAFILFACYPSPKKKKDDTLPATFSPAPSASSYLLATQYQNAVRALLGDAAAAAVTLPENPRLNGLKSVAASQLALSPAVVELYEANAYKAAAAAIPDNGHLESLAGCTLAQNGLQTCLTQLISKLGPKAFRRPLEQVETETLSALSTASMQMSAPYEAGQQLLAALLQMPQFLYQLDVGETPNENGWAKRTAFEVAERMSFALTSNPPDDALLLAAQQSTLEDDVLKEQASRLLQVPAARQTLSEFVTEWLDLESLDQTRREAALFPLYSAALSQAMKAETGLFFQSVVFDDDTSLLNAFDAPYTYANPLLADLYALSMPTGVSGMVRVSLPDVLGRQGFLMQGAFLTRWSHPTRTSPTLRGKFIRENFLCQSVDAPPQNVPEFPEVTGKTVRERVEQHMGNAGCSGCHMKMDPIGLGFENFDAIGAYRFVDEKIPIDASSQLDGLKFSNSKDLVALLKKDERVSKCLVRVFFRQVASHIETSAEAPEIDRMAQWFAANNHSTKKLLTEWVASPAFRYTWRVKTP